MENIKNMYLKKIFIENLESANVENEDWSLSAKLEVLTDSTDDEELIRDSLLEWAAYDIWS